MMVNCYLKIWMASCKYVKFLLKQYVIRGDISVQKRDLGGLKATIKVYFDTDT